MVIADEMLTRFLIGVAHEMQAKYPKIFGDHGGSSRVFSIADVGYSLGMVIGPLISGVLYRAVGFDFINIFSKSFTLQSLNGVLPTNSYFSCGVSCFGRSIVSLA